MLLIAYLCLVILLAIAGLLRFKWTPRDSIVVNPAFLTFQKSYFNVYFLALFAEWLQSPYVYRIYSHYGFIDTQIAVIYVCGFVSSILFGTALTYLADKFGRRNTCVLFCLVYSVSCATKASTNYGVLIIGRILGGLSTSILFSSIEAWYVHEHTQTHDFPAEWIAITFTKTSFFNGIIAITAGVVAHVTAEVFHLGPISPFITAVLFLMGSAALMQANWPENYGAKSVKMLKPCFESLQLIVNNPHILATGIVTSLFESVMYIFVFLWTPVLDPARPPLGIVFSCFMACVMIGGILFEMATRKKIEPMGVLIFAVFIGYCANVFCSFGSAEHPQKTFLAFLVLQFACGLYFPAMSAVRRKVLPEEHHVGVMNWFRVPLNVIASVVLLALHDTHSSEGITAIFTLCSVLMIIALICLVSLERSLKHSDQANNDEQSINGENSI